MIELTILGAGPAYTSRPGAVGACLSRPDRRRRDRARSRPGVVHEPGRSARAERLRSVVISHLHPDHYIDLVPLRHYLLWDFDPARRVAVLGPTALADRLDALHDEPGSRRRRSTSPISAATESVSSAG